MNGLFLLNKPAGLTSNQALQRVKRLIRAKKAGHTGSLDPAATGMLPLCFGEATKVCAYLLDADKSYRVGARLGEATDTGDADGQVIETADVPDLDADEWRRISGAFVGQIEQIPPMYSALKKDGKRLYELARKGEVVERKPRKIHIHAIDVVEARGKRLLLNVRCSKGTYIRTLVEDLAKAAGTVAHTASLHRETVGDLDPDGMLDLRGAEEIAESGIDALRSRLIPADAALSGWPSIALTAADVSRFCGGQAVNAELPPGQEPGRLLRVYGPDDRFLGIGEGLAGSLVAPRRIFRLGE
ncbi:MAG: tRNA pseudouridine(55) synthase TruB [Gammaproteobacteria bacterium]|nr:tRNA pseudouridine(55) synthase TruB [Gammaproteobacteria bacterium]